MAEEAASAAAMRAYQEALGMQDGGHDESAQFGAYDGFDRGEMMYVDNPMGMLNNQEMDEAQLLQLQQQQQFMQGDIDQQQMGQMQQFSQGDIDQQQMGRLQELMNMPEMQADEDTAQQILHFMEEQERQQNAAQMANYNEALQQTRPEKHYFTISQDGTILEATHTVTGFSPEVLLMTSAYDTLYDEDLPGFLCVKTQFWDKGQPDVEVYIRRRSIDGDWIWLTSKAVYYANDAEISATILEESVVDDEDMARKINRLTRITAILVQAVEAAWLTQARQAKDEAAKKKEEEDPAKNAAAAAATAAINKMNGGDPSQIINEDTEAYKAEMAAIRALGVQLPDNVQDVQNLIEIAQSTMMRNGDVLNGESKFGQEALEQIGAEQKQKVFDPNSVVESVRQGVRLDLGLTRLSTDEVKLITLVLLGKIQSDEVAPKVRASLANGYGIKGAVREYILGSERQTSRHRSSSYTSSPPLKRPKPHNNSRISVPSKTPSAPLPPIAVVNLSYTYIGNTGVELLSEILTQEGSCLKTLDISFCGIEEKGLLILARALAKRKKKRIPSLRGVILSGNYMSPRAASEVGTSLSPAGQGPKLRVRNGSRKRRTGYDTETSSDEDDEDDDDQVSSRRRKSKKGNGREEKRQEENEGLHVLHVANSSMTAETLSRLLDGLGQHCTIRELNISSNSFGVAGAAALVKVLETKQRSRDHKATVAMPFLDRLDLSNNKLGDEGTTQLARAVMKRTEIHIVDLKLSSNSIGPGGVETIMNRLLGHNLISLSLDKNTIGDQGCQLVAASLQSMQSLSRLNLGFNQIGSRGITSLMRSLVMCKSITYLGLSGNILRISGAMALAFTLSQHPRLEELDLDNCCLGQAAQCHLVAGIISNRWVPMKRLKGFAVGPPMVAIGALDPRAANSSNEECLRIRKDEQMKTILQWMETNRTAKKQGAVLDHSIVPPQLDSQNPKFLTPDYVSQINDVHGMPSENSYLRLLGWLSRIPFDEDELNALQKYFYDADGGDGDRGSDGYINLKNRGDILAALDENAADEIREELPSLAPIMKGSVGIDLDKLYGSSDWDAWEVFKGTIADSPPHSYVVEDEDEEQNQHQAENAHYASEMETDKKMPESAEMHTSESGCSVAGKEKKLSKVKARITMFPQFEQQLEELKASATELIEQEEDPMQHEVILTQYAEASLTILRQLRYHCMNFGLDGWRQSGLTRKILVVDDSAVTRKLVARAFEKAHFIVDTASNGAEGVEKLKASLYDIAFMDIDMPVMNGFEATRRLREWEDEMRPGARQPICALTATYVDDFERSELMRFKEAGLDVMESKPCNIPRLFKVVDDVAPMFSDLSITVMQKERSENSLQSGHSSSGFSTS